MTNFDGNLAALNIYQREQDLLDDQDNALEFARDEFADALFEAFFKSNIDVIDEVQDYLEDAEESYKNIEEACEHIASRYDDIEAVENAYGSFKL